MTGQYQAVFVLNLVQDVNILRPLIFMATRDFGFQSKLLISGKFLGRDLFGIWQAEISEICAETGAAQAIFENDWQALQNLDGCGVIFAASESNLPAHITTHNIFRYAPASYLKVTLQHGFECIGFRHSADHIKAHGQTALFGADLVCAWYGTESLTSMAPSQRTKLVVTGPTAVLQQPRHDLPDAKSATGIVCENLHSVRLNVAGDFKVEFVDAFNDFCRLLAADGRKVALRPHPGGQYVLKNGLELPANAKIANAPIYRLDLRGYSYGISAPSSVLIDMLLADIPTAVWRDRDGAMDADAYAGITSVCTPSEWNEFAAEAVANPQPFVALQRDFLNSQGMPLEPEKVFANFAEIFASVRRSPVQSVGATVERDRILFVANSRVPTLQLSFEKPLASLIARGEIRSQLLTEAEIAAHSGADSDGAKQIDWIEEYISAFDPALVIFCRYSGPGSDTILEWTRKSEVPVLYHIDDDLLAIPTDIGEKKFNMHNQPARLATVRKLLTSADLVYASTTKLEKRLLGYFPDIPTRAGQVYCSSSVIRQPTPGMARKVGYMASADHSHNLTMVLPAIVQLLEKNPHIGFEFFGSIPVPPELLQFGDRISTAPPISDYGAFLKEFAKFGWDVGICPLAPIEFNMMKADTKWVEYTTVGAAVVASRGTVYDDCCASGCGILAETVDEWLSGLERLINDDAFRLDQIQRAQRKLESEYSVSRLREQITDVIAECRLKASQRSPARKSKVESGIVQ